MLLWTDTSFDEKMQRSSATFEHWKWASPINAKVGVKNENVPPFLDPKLSQNQTGDGAMEQMSDRILVKEAVGFQMLFAAKYKFHFQQRLLKLNKTIPGIHGLLGYIGVDWVILHFRLSRGLGETALESCEGD